MTTKENSLSLNTKFHNVIATLTADKAMFLSFLCLSFHLQAVSTTILLTSRLLFLSPSLAVKLWEGETEREILTPPSATSLDVPWARHKLSITPLELLKKTLVVLGNKCVASSDTIHPLKTELKKIHICIHIRNHKLPLIRLLKHRHAQRPLYTILVHNT